jgi:hypothetical protein
VQKVGKRTLGRPRSRLEDNIKIDLHEMGRGAWTGLIWHNKTRYIKCEEFLD